MLAFSTPTLLDINMLKFMGVSVKETESPIGFFGTGLKYAVAVLLRNGHQFRLYIDGEQYQFRTANKLFRGQEHQIIVMTEPSGAELELPFTLNYGRTWEVWMAYRELVSNTLDEGGTVSPTDAVPDSTGKTVILVEGAEIEECQREHYKYFLCRDKVGEIYDSVAVHRNKTSEGIFYRGVRVATLNSTARFAYEVTGHRDLTEDRTLKNPGSLFADIGIYTVRKCKDPAVLKEMIRVSGPQDSSFEAGLDFDWSEPSDLFVEVCGEMISVDRTKVNAGARATWERATATSSINTGPFSKMQQLALTRAIRLLKQCGYSDIDQYPILLMVNNPHNQLGQARDGKIYLTDRCFAMGVKSLMGTLLEEYLHLSKEVYDCTREFQDLLLTMVIDLLEEHVIGEAI